MDWKEKMQDIAYRVKKRDNFVVIHHYDADGCSSGAILVKALEREGKKVTKKWVKQLYKETTEEIKGLGENYVFVDFGSAQLEYLIEEFGDNLFVFDHHEKIKADHPNHFSPFNHGINGGNEISASGIAYLFAKTLNEKNTDLVPLAIVGAIGDMQDFHGSLIGMNAEILKEGQEKGLIVVEKDLKLYGRVTRPLTSFLMFSSSPMLPELTANQENCVSFLHETGIDLKRGETWRTYIDLSSEEKKKLTTALILHLHKFNVPEWKIKELIGDVYTFPNENRKSPLSDVKEFSTLLNACGRHGKAEIGIEVCLGDRGEFLLTAMSLMQEHRRQLRQGIEFVTSNGVLEEENFYFFDSGSQIKDSIVGIVAGMLYGSGIIENNKPIIAIAQNDDESLKLSGRATKELLQKGLNLGLAFSKICKELGEGNEGGGHAIAAGVKLKKENKERFLKLLNEKIAEQYNSIRE